MAPTAVGDPKFGCGYDGRHLAEPNSTAALTAAVGDSKVTCIKLARGTYALSSTLSIGRNRTLAIVAEGEQATLDGGGGVQLLFAQSSAVVALANLALINGYTNFSGGAIFNKGTMDVHACVVTNNTAAMDGGAIRNLAGTMRVHTTAFENNKADIYGGAIFSHKGKMDLQACRLDKNKAQKFRCYKDTLVG